MPQVEYFQPQSEEISPQLAGRSIQVAKMLLKSRETQHKSLFDSADYELQRHLRKPSPQAT